MLGHWGASPALSFIYHHANRIIKANDLDMISWPARTRRAGRTRPVLSRRLVFRNLSGERLNEEGLLASSKSFPFPGGIGSHCTPETPDHSRGRRAGLRAFARMRRCFR
jgi:xylulose-5-phosphate/fructose-6-phosphate phosphoketolase